MTRLIDANALKYDFGEIDDGQYKRTELYVTNEAIAQQPTIDAVPVIRCKDCKWYEFDVSHRCGYTGLNGYIAEDDFCSKAEPKVTE